MVIHELIPQLHGLWERREGAELVKGKYRIPVYHETVAYLCEMLIVFIEAWKVGIGKVDVHLQTLEEKRDSFLVLREKSFLFHGCIHVSTGHLDLEDSFTLRGHSLPDHGRQLKGRVKNCTSNFLEVILKHLLSFAEQLAIIWQQLPKTGWWQYSGNIVGSFFFEQIEVHFIVVNIVVCPIHLLAKANKKFTPDELRQMGIFWLVLDGFQKVGELVVIEGGEDRLSCFVEGVVVEKTQQIAVVAHLYQTIIFLHKRILSAFL